MDPAAIANARSCELIREHVPLRNFIAPSNVEAIQYSLSRLLFSRLLVRSSLSISHFYSASGAFGSVGSCLPFIHGLEYTGPGYLGVRCCLQVGTVVLCTISHMSSRREGARSGGMQCVYTMATNE